MLEIINHRDIMQFLKWKDLGDHLLERPHLADEKACP